MNATAELYEWPPTRSQRARWVLEELGIDYRSRPVNMLEREQDSDAYRAVHPLGVVPALRTDRYLLRESVAIVLQLIDEHPESGLAPPVGTPERAAYYQWCVFACAELDPAVMAYFDNTMRPLEHMRPPGRPHDPAFAGYARDAFADRARMLSHELEGREFLVGARFSGADILVGHSCFMATVTGLIGGHPVLEAYLGRLHQRPAYRRAYRDFLEAGPYPNRGTRS